MKPSQLRVEHVYRGKDKTTRLVMDAYGQEVIYVGNDGNRHVQDKKLFAEWAIEDTFSTLNIGRNGYLKPCPCCMSRRVWLSTVYQTAVCFKCGFMGPNFGGHKPPRRISKQQQMHWWNRLHRIGLR
jgi:hypothetical protein